MAASFTTAGGRYWKIQQYFITIWDCSAYHKLRQLHFINLRRESQNSTRFHLSQHGLLIYGTKCDNCFNLQQLRKSNANWRTTCTNGRSNHVIMIFPPFFTFAVSIAKRPVFPFVNNASIYLKFLNRSASITSLCLRILTLLLFHFFNPCLKKNDELSAFAEKKYERASCLAVTFTGGSVSPFTHTFFQKNL